MGAEDLIPLAQGGDETARERLIRSYTPFVVRVAARVTGRFLRPGEDEEISIGLLAFNEAIDSYRADAGSSFTTFAETVIRRRLVDYYRRQRARAEIPFSELEGVEEEANALRAVEARAAQEDYRQRAEMADRRDEILQYKRLLTAYGIELRELVALSPRHADARERAKRVARIIAGTPELSEYLQRHRTLPLARLCARVDVGLSRKTLERQRKYIIALSLILMNDFWELRQYVEGT